MCAALLYVIDDDPIALHQFAAVLRMQTKHEVVLFDAPSQLLDGLALRVPNVVRR